jgi:hypothetical protein
MEQSLQRVLLFTFSQKFLFSDLNMDAIEEDFETS